MTNVAKTANYNLLQWPINIPRHSDGPISSAQHCVRLCVLHLLCKCIRAFIRGNCGASPWRSVYARKYFPFRNLLRTPDYRRMLAHVRETPANFDSAGIACAIVVALACTAMIECVICERNFPRFGGKVAGGPVRIRFTREKRQTALATNVGMQYRNKRVSRAHSE